MTEATSGRIKSSQSRPKDGLFFELSGGPDAPVAARRAVLAGEEKTPGVQMPESVREDVLLLVSELVTNAVRHAGVGPEHSLQTDIRWRPGWVRVEVTDPSTGSASIGARSEGDGSGGFGLFLVEQIADRWGVRRTPAGTSVWFELVSE